MSTPNYALAFKKTLTDDSSNLNMPRYSDGSIFMNYKNTGGGRMTQYQPTSLSISGLRQQSNIPTDNTMFRNFAINDSIGIGNESLKNWVYTTQTLSAPSLDNKFCTTDSDCTQFSENHKCNSNYQPWNDSYGNQSGSVCVATEYPELKGGVYNRKLQNEGGIGRNCFTDSECNTGAGYFCNNSTDIFGSNIQQNGFCAMKYQCGDKERFLGTPYNSAVPLAPSQSQNNNGEGYSSKDVCMQYAAAQQDCIQLKSTDTTGKTTLGNWFAVFPGYCPTSSSLRKNPVTGLGALRTSNLKQLDEGFVIPGFATSLASNMGSKKGAQGGAQGAFLYNKFKQSEKSGISEPMQYSMSINPRP